MLAYSSVEHMGIIALGVGIGGGAAFGAVLHAVNHSLTKGMLFLLAGNILAVYRTKASATVKGVMRTLPLSGALWLVGFFAITGSPPFGPFMSEFAVLKGTLEGGHTFAAVAYLVLLAIIFIGMAGTFLKMSQGVPEGAEAPARRESIAMTLPPMALAAFVLLLGVYVPLPLQAVLRQAAASLGGS
jgi:hydrogenase-4 component F